MSRRTDKIALFNQDSYHNMNEHRLVEAVSLREIYVSKINSIIDEVREKRCIWDQKRLLDSYIAMNQLREATIAFMETLEIWQDAFTKVIRPKLHNCDYLLERMLHQTDFINTAEFKRLYNYTISIGNFLLLPIANKRTLPPMKVSQELNDEILKFANPSDLLIERIIRSYQILINCTHEKHYKKFYSLKKWLETRWIPNLIVMIDNNGLLQADSADNFETLKLHNNTPLINSNKRKLERKKKVIRKIDEQEEIKWINASLIDLPNNMEQRILSNMRTTIQMNINNQKQLNSPINMKNKPQILLPTIKSRHFERSSLISLATSASDNDTLSVFSINTPSNKPIVFENRPEVFGKLIGSPTETISQLKGGALNKLPTITTSQLRELYQRMELPPDDR